MCLGGAAPDERAIATTKVVSRWPISGFLAAMAPNAVPFSSLA